MEKQQMCRYVPFSTMKILLATPPLLQPNAPYAATPLLAAWLSALGHETAQADFSLELILELFSPEGLRAVMEELGLDDVAVDGYLKTIEPVIGFLQGKDPSAARRIAKRGWLPEGDRLARAYAEEDQLGWNFRGLSANERAKYLASLYLDDIADAAAELDPRFGFSRYAEKLAASLADFQPMADALEQDRSIFIRWLDRLVDRAMLRHKPEMVAITVPFPGCLMGALAIARRIKQTCPSVHVTMGGGYVNTELRDLRDPAIFNHVDTITLDSGFLPLQQLAAQAGRDQWVRTFALEDGAVRYYDCDMPEPPHDTLPAPDFRGLPLESYIGMVEVLNPAASLWTEARWNKLVLAHGCCWRRCAFCDTSVDYIRRYDPATPRTICDWIERVAADTGFAGFHFVDEALPPDLLDGLCDELLRRGLRIEWWGNIRYEKRFSPALVRKMARAGCIAVTGGLETCCDRTLGLMRKGITVAHAEQVLSDLSNEGILTHAYLMYGFPTQTFAETVDALDTVRRLFDEGVLHSAYWHRFALTAHSGIARNPEAFGIVLEPVPTAGFALNEIPFAAAFDHDLDDVGRALKTALYNFQLGIGFDIHASDWFRQGA